jgi:uncharacterized protein DUF416
MAVTRFDPDQLRYCLESFDLGHRVAFAAYWAERLLPFHEEYARVTGDANSPFVRSCVDAAWRAAIGELPDRRRVAAMQARILEVSPEVDYPPVLAAAAMEATSAAWDALEVIATGSSESAAGAAISVRRALEVFLTNRDHRGDIQFEDMADTWHIDQDELFLTEVETLGSVLNVLEAKAPIRAKVEKLRQQARATDGSHLLGAITGLSRRL